MPAARRTFVLSLLIANLAHAQPNPPPPPTPVMTFNYVTVDKQKGTSAQFRNNIVVIFFFKTDEPRARESVATVISEASALAGVKALGVCLTTDENRAATFIRETNIDFPVHVDPRSGAVGVARQFDVRITPWCVILDPDGRMVASLPPAQLPDRLRQQLKLTPPRMADAAVISAGGEVLKLTERFLKSGNPRAAMRALSVVPTDARTDPTIGDRLAKITTQLDASMEKFLDTSEKLINDGKLGSALVFLQQLSSATDGTPAQAKVLDQLQSVTDDPDLKAKANAQRADALADDLLAEAADHQSIGDDLTAFQVLSSLVTTYPASPAAAAGRKQLADWEADPARKRRLYDAMQGSKATPMLKSAESFLALGLKDRAKLVLEQLVKEYPNTTAAETGRGLLKKL